MKSIEEKLNEIISISLYDCPGDPHNHNYAIAALAFICLEELNMVINDREKVVDIIENQGDIKIDDER